MRRTTIHRIHRTTLAAAAAVALLAGCGTAGDGSGTGDSAGGGRSAGSGTPSSTPSGPSAPATPSTSGTPSVPGNPSGGCVTQAELTAADDGHSLCLTRGGVVRIDLAGIPDRPWQPLTATGNALKAVNAGVVVQPGHALAAYEAVAAGTARLTSYRPLCAQGSPGQVACQGLQNWTVTVRVR
ncbi:hypothetical protein ACFC09_04295 [Streptomyces sp. NPDC056161]|uniref:hypothetical protein n=1 Tax=Streptomyces sp. NPDC056161 TaxID=3345732 RepID=UPI0035DEB32D